MTQKPTYEELDQRVQELEKAEVEHKRAEQKQLSSIFRSAPIGIGLVVNRKLKQVNSRLCEISGYDEGELINQSARILYPSDEEFEFVGREKYAQIIEHGTGTVETRWQRKDGTIIDVLLSSTPIDLEDHLKGVTFTALDITERERTEESLRESEERFRTIVGSSEAGYFLLGRDGKFQDVNSAWLSMHGFTSKDEVIGKHFSLTQDDTVLLEARNIVDRVLDGKSVPTSEFSRRRKDGSVGYHTFTVSPVLKLGEIVGLEGFLIDTTQQKIVEESWRESKRRFHSIFDSMGELVVLHELVLDATGRPVDYRIIECNPAFSSTLGIPKDRAVGALASKIYGTGEPPYLEIYAHVAQTGQRTQFETYYEPMQKHFQISVVSPVKGSFATISMDVTERVQRQQEINLLNRLYSVLSQVSQAVMRASSPQPFLEESCRVIVEEGGFLLAWIGRVETQSNKVIPAAVWGEAGEYARGITVYVDDRPEGRGPTGTSIREQRPIVYNDFLNDPLAKPWVERATSFGIHAAAAFPIETRGRVWGALTIYSEEVGFFGEKDQRLLEKVAGSIGFALDSLDKENHRKHTEEELRRLAEAVRQASEGIVITDLEGNITYINPMFEKITGYTFDEIAGKNPRVFKSGKQDQTFYKLLWDTILAGERWAGRMVNKRKNGVFYTAECSISPVKDKNGTIVNFVWITRDATKELELEERLRQAQKMEAIGTLAGGIAHDFNNILGAILGYAEMAYEDSLSGLVKPSDLNQVLQAGHRAKDLVKQILAFSRQAETQKIPLRPAALLKESIKLLRSSIPTTIDIQQDIDPETGLILADPTQIHQIIMNLCTNAYHAMEETGGTLSISIVNKAFSEHDLIDFPSVQPGSFVQLSIKDTGFGIAPEIRERIFDPYFTTKEAGKGTGMGLAIVHGITKAYGGFITCHSEIGAGTVFNIFLPVVLEPSVSETKEFELIPVGTERILFVDDEEILAKMGQTMLERLGYTVTTQMSSIEALATFKTQPDAFDLVITDQTMPGMTGSDLARRMLQIRPGLPVILCTGYSSVVSEERARSYGIKGFALKPISRKDIAVLIRKILDEGKSIS